MLVCFCFVRCRRGAVDTNYRLFSPQSYFCGKIGSCCSKKWKRLKRRYVFFFNQHPCSASNSNAAHLHTLVVGRQHVIATIYSNVAPISASQLLLTITSYKPKPVSSNFYSFTQLLELSQRASAETLPRGNGTPLQEHVGSPVILYISRPAARSLEFHYFTIPL